MAVKKAASPLEALKDPSSTTSGMGTGSFSRAGMQTLLTILSTTSQTALKHRKGFGGPLRKYDTRLVQRVARVRLSCSAVYS